MSVASNILTATIHGIRQSYHPCCATVRRICPETGRVLSEEKYDFSQQHIRLKNGRRPTNIPEPVSPIKQIAAVKETINGLRKPSGSGQSRLAILPWEVLGISRKKYYVSLGGSTQVLKDILLKASAKDIVIDQHMLAKKSIEISHMFKTNGVPDDPFPMLPPEVIVATAAQAAMHV